MRDLSLPNPPEGAIVASESEECRFKDWEIGLRREETLMRVRDLAIGAVSTAAALFMVECDAVASPLVIPAAQVNVVIDYVDFATQSFVFGPYYNGFYSGIQNIGGVSYIGNDFVATASVGGQPNPNVSVLVINGGAETVLAESVIFYYFGIVGPRNLSVPINIGASIFVNNEVLQNNSVNLPTLYKTLVKGFTPSNSIPYTSELDDCATLDYGNLALLGQISGTCVVDGQVSVKSNTANLIEMAVETQESGPQTVELLLDPVITIDSSFAEASEYSVQVSTGLGNSPEVAGVAEPESLYLLGIGLVSAAVVRLIKRGHRFRAAQGPLQLK
jgi:hypothetical protein